VCPPVNEPDGPLNPLNVWIELLPAGSFQLIVPVVPAAVDPVNEPVSGNAVPCATLADPLTGVAPGVVDRLSVGGVDTFTENVIAVDPLKLSATVTLTVYVPAVVYV